MVIKPFLKLWDSSGPQWEPLSTNGKNMEQWWTFPGVAGRPKLPQERSDDSSKRSQKTPQQHLKNCRPHLPQLKVSVHDSTIRKRLGKNGLHGRVPRRKLLLSKKNIKSHLSFARKHLDDPQDFWENTLWIDETKVELFGRCVSHYIWRKSNSISEKEHHTNSKIWWW